MTAEEAAEYSHLDAGRYAAGGLITEAGAWTAGEYSGCSAAAQIAWGRRYIMERYDPPIDHAAP